MSGFGLTSRFKFAVPAEGNESWLEYLTNWADKMDVQLTVLSNKDYVISGLVVTTDPTSLDFSYTAGSLSINSETVDISSGNGTTQASSFNWLYVQENVLKVSTNPPTGLTYVPIACLQTDDTGVIGPADMRPSFPTINGISIAPFQVNPSSNINMAAGKRVVHADTNVGANITMFNNAEVSNVINWGNQAASKDWVERDLTDVVALNAKFAVLNCHIATFNAVSNGWAVLEVRTSSDHDANTYPFVDYGHPGANVLNASQIGHTNQIILPLKSDKTIEVRTLVDSLGVSGVYYAKIQLMGYVV